MGKIMAVSDTLYAEAAAASFPSQATRTDIERAAMALVAATAL